MKFVIPDEFLVFKKYFDHKKNEAFIPDFYADCVQNDSNRAGFDKTFQQYLHYLDCTRESKLENYRLMQTIGTPYRVEMIKILYLVMLFDKASEEVINQILERHKANLEYEKSNPPIVYSKKTKEPKEQKSSSTPKMTKTERYKMKQALKFANIEFKIKI